MGEVVRKTVYQWDTHSHGMYSVSGTSLTGDSGQSNVS